MATIFAAQAVVLFLRTIAPVDACRLRQGSDFADPIDELLMFNVCWDVQCCNATHNGLIHTTSNANKNSFLVPARQDRRQLVACARKSIPGEMVRRYGGHVDSPGLV
ncbi:hypothetical protein LP420_21905 [Massilia sp. B-10]|nr:hypothetical protein LP420_21905 [Massilia sp. B-10]